ncbi:MAG: peptidoglycan editing factor PgeF [Slackia sp.]|nr:peptidoglycan editing factor PgeF [Slackia sp.]
MRIAFTQRTGGESDAPFDSLNLGDHVGDDSAHVAANRRIVLAALQASGASLIQPNQVHGDTVVTCESREDAAACHALARKGADGVVVRAHDVAALLCFADCVPVIIVSPAGHFAVVHAGWRGVMNRISERAIDALCIGGIEPSDLNIYIGPHIEACCFEVDEELARRFVREFGDAAVSSHRHVDLTAALVSGFVSRGVDVERIACAHVCTMCDSEERYYSYRRSAGRCGRHGAVAVRVSEGEGSGAS